MSEAIIYNTDDKKINIFSISIFFMVFVVSQLSISLNKFSLYILIPGLFVYSLIRNPQLVLKYKPLFYFLLLIILSALTSVKSLHMDTSLHEIKTLSGGYALCYIVTQFSLKNHRYIKLFYILYILMFFVLIFRGGSEGLFLSKSEGFSTEDLNANYFGYIGFCAIICSFFIWQFFGSLQSNLKQIFYLFLFVICSIVSIVANVFAATKAGTIISLIVILLLLISKYFSHFSKKTIISTVLLLIIVYAASHSFKRLFEGSMLQERIQTINIQKDARFLLLSDAYKVGMKNPFLGVGPGNFKYYSFNGGFSHSTFFELFANNGIFGLLLYVVILYLFLKNIWRLKPNDENERKIKLYFLVFFILFVIYNFIYVFHTTPELICFYYILSAHLYIYLQDNTSYDWL